MLRSYRDLDIIMLNAEAEVRQMVEDFERMLMGNRMPVEEVNDGEDEREDSGEAADSTEDDSPIYPQGGGAPTGKLI